MAVKRELNLAGVALPDIAALIGARWFAGKARGVAGNAGGFRRVVFIGMGSSRFAAVSIAALLRSRGVDAVAELASTGSPTRPSADTLAVGISASGGTVETVEALSAHRGTSHCIAITNEPASELASAGDVVLPLLAGREEGGVSCLTFQATVAVLLLLTGRLLDDAPHAPDLRPAIEAAVRLREERHAWLDEVVEIVDRSRMIATIAPAERLSSALQSALMLREGPRIAADAAETGDWLHVDVYLSKRPGYCALLFVGSRFDGDVLEWSAKRAFPVIAIGEPVSGAAMCIECPRADDPHVRLLVETGVTELAAADLWRRRIAAGDDALVDPQPAR